MLRMFSFHVNLTKSPLKLGSVTSIDADIQNVADDLRLPNNQKPLYVLTLSTQDGHVLVDHDDWDLPPQSKDKMLSGAIHELKDVRVRICVRLGTFPVH